ncbi:putative 37S ribosomal protein S18 [Escovopsis weberi]|uniref:Putative 37S ribosomal protein S18 n=1 Tax=Escovopsis weberi TaxID=150374 RepID=A0A0M9VW70_ESCWE|nr:putative 37S ribosomal protein S18 [Escovopsis weberi]
MSRSVTSRLVLRSSQALAIPRCAAAHGKRPFSQTSSRQADPKDDARTRVPARPNFESQLNDLRGVFGNPQSSSNPAQPQPNTMASLAQSRVFQVLNKSTIDTSSLSGGAPRALEKKEDELEPFHFHVYSHKHNTHIICSRPNREPIISMSCGNIGFRKSRRGTFDSAYSLTKYVLERLVHTGWPMKISRLELVLSGFGQGREAVLKVLMSPEGKMLREKIVRVADATKVKFGGTRSKKPRRL